LNEKNAGKAKANADFGQYRMKALTVRGVRLMTVIKTSGVMRQLRRAALLSSGGDISDADLLEAFISRRDEAAFEALLRRHGPMVLGVARRILRHPHDAEDAFQATFLVLVRKAASIVPRALVGHWLYGVAYRTAMKAKAMKSKRRAKESLASPRPRAAAGDTGDLWEELQPVLDRELNALPAKYRLPVFLCDLEGKKHREAARQLGWPEGTLETRLTAGRRLLARRLARQGLAPSGGTVAAVIAQNAAAGAVPSALVVATLKAGMLFAAGSATAAGAIAVQITTLAEGVMKAMLFTKVKTAAGLWLALAILCAAPTVLTYSTAGENSPSKAAVAQDKSPAGLNRGLHVRLENREWQVRSVDAAKSTITVQDRGSLSWGVGLRYVETTSGSFGPSGLYLRDLRLTRDAHVTLDGKPARLTDLKPGTKLTLRFGAEGFALARIEAFVNSQPGSPYILKEIAPARNTISVVIDGDVRLDALRLAKDADIEIHGNRGVRKAALRDLEPGMTVHLELRPDEEGKLTVHALKASK
jgi:RNA polymerase sigma factor (sigma-70 family)